MAADARKTDPGDKTTETWSVAGEPAGAVPAPGATSASSHPIPDHIGRYQIEREIGRGGMGVVYLARDPKLGRRVAIKILPHEMTSEIMRRRLKREARTAATLNHPNIAIIHDLGQADGINFIAMEYIEGKTLDERLQAECAGLGGVLDIAVQIADGLTAAHDHKIIHRDLKPRNIMVTAESRVKILDFGLAKPLQPVVDEDETWSLPLTVGGKLIGTPEYMSPEQARGLDLDARSDLFSFGVVLYEMLTGCTPFFRSTLTKTLGAIVTEQPIPAARLNPEIPPELVQILDLLLAKDPDDRYQLTNDLLVDLKEVKRTVEPQGSAAVRVELQRRRQSIAVLPFVDRSAQHDQEYYCDGMTREMVHALTQIEGLDVAAGVAAGHSAAENLDVRKIGERLGAGTVLEGGVEKAGNTLRFTVQLLDAGDLQCIWSQQYDCKTTDVFAIQDDVARMIVASLDVAPAELAAPLVRHHTENVDAYEHYLKGRFHWNTAHQGGFYRAIECFETAIENDPAYALAHAAVANSYAALGAVGIERPITAFASAKASADKAMEIDPDLAEAHLALASRRFWFDRDYDSAEREFRRSIELNPQSAAAHALFGLMLGWLGRSDEAVAESGQARERDPLSPLISAWCGYTFYLVRQHDRAVHECRTALEVDPHYPAAVWTLATIHLATAQREEAVAALEEVVAGSDRATFFLGLLGRAYAESGRHGQARVVLDDLRARSKRVYVAPSCFAGIHIGLGEKDQGARWLEEAFEQHNAFWWHPLDPFLASLRADPRFFNDEVWRAVMPAGA